MAARIIFFRKANKIRSLPCLKPFNGCPLHFGISQNSSTYLERLYIINFLHLPCWISSSYYSDQTPGLWALRTLFFSLTHPYHTIFSPTSYLIQLLKKYFFKEAIPDIYSKWALISNTLPAFVTLYFHDLSSVFPASMKFSDTTTMSFLIITASPEPSIIAVTL